MAFPTKLLNDGEEVVLDVRHHWWVLAGPVSVVIVVLAGGVTAHTEGAPTAVDLVLLVLLAVASAWLLVRYLRWVTTSLVVTTERLIHRTGIIAKAGREIPLEHLTNISYRQRIFERIIGMGDLLLESAGRDSAEVFSDLPHPATIQNEIYRQIDAAARPTGGGRELSVPEQIDKLDGLRRRRVITQAEFDAKKTQLLNRM